MRDEEQCEQQRPPIGAACTHRHSLEAALHAGAGEDGRDMALQALLLRHEGLEPRRQLVDGGIGIGGLVGVDLQRESNGGGGACRCQVSGRYCQGVATFYGRRSSTRAPALSRSESDVGRRPRAQAHDAIKPTMQHDMHGPSCGPCGTESTTCAHTSSSNHQDGMQVYSERAAQALES